MAINVLITSLSRKVPLIKAVKKALLKTGMKGSVYGADSSPECIGSYFVDHFWEMPPLSGLTPHDILTYCLQHHIDCIIPTRDGELLFFAENKEEFLESGVSVMISGKKALECCLDKRLFYQTITEEGFLGIQTTLSLEKLDCESYVVKERFGAGSIKVGIKLSKEEASNWAKSLENPVFQPYIPGKEISIDLFVEKNGQVKGCVTRSRDLVIHGESQITSTIKTDHLEETCSNLAQTLKLSGHVMFQCIHDEAKDAYYILECNPRFGGASTLSCEVGLDSFYWFFMEILGNDLKEIPFIRELGEKRLVRYPEDLFI